LIAIVERGSFSQAAVALGVSQPAVSMSVSRLEGELGVRIFNRDAHGSVLTEVGGEVIAYARRILRESQELHEMADGWPQAPLATVEVIAANGLMPMVSAIVSTFRAASPETRVRLVVDHSRLSIQRMLTSAADMAITRGTDPPDGLVALPLVDDELVAVFPAGHPDAEKPIDVAELAKFPLIAPRDDFIGRLPFNSIFETQSAAPRVVCEVTEPSDALQLVHAGVAPALSSRIGLGGIFASANVVVRPLNPRVNSRVTLIRREGELTPAATTLQQVVIDFVRERFGRLVGDPAD
jgi:DNA-binding transcriptional LysR family regulator